MELIMWLCLGVSLSAACGFRIFVPPLIMAIADRSGYLALPEDSLFGSDRALVIFALAALVEVGAYYIPWLDNVLDSIEGPVAVVAGVLVTETFLGDMAPELRWVLAAVLGGTAAGATETLTVMTRLASTATTGGLGNPVVSTAELGSSVVLSLTAIAVPGLALVIVLGLSLWVLRKIIRRLQKRQRRQEQTPWDETS